MVRALLEQSGMLTIDADSIGHEVLEPNGAAFDQVVDRWPTVIVDDKIDREVLAAIVFSDAAELKALEWITHPHIFGMINRRVQEIDDLVVVEIPLLISPGSDDGWQRMVVDCDDSIRRERLTDRGMTSADVNARMRSQPSRSEWLAKADLVVPNHLSLEELAVTVGEISSRL